MLHESTKEIAPTATVDTRVVYHSDNLPQLHSLPDRCIDLVYIDPPFNTNRDHKVSWGSTKEKRAFEDRHGSTQTYVDFMRPRCEEIARVLKKTGSLYYHCDWHASHYVKVMLDQIFGEDHFLNEIIWHYTGGGRSKTTFSRKHDILLWYRNGSKWCFNIDQVRVPYKPSSGYAKGGITSASGKHYKPNPKGTPVDDVWDIPMINPLAKERLGYPTQKPLTLLDRVIKAGSNPNDVVLDAFCGCGTTLVAAENHGRQWIGIDISSTACRVTAKRLHDVCGLAEDEEQRRIGRGFVVRDGRFESGK